MDELWLHEFVWSRNALVTFEAFKVWGGEIHAVEAFFRVLPQETKRGWESFDF